MRELLFAIMRDLTVYGTPRWRPPVGACPRL